MLKNMSKERKFPILQYEHLLCERIATLQPVIGYTVT
jgi:hypothetical protein